MRISLRCRARRPGCGSCASSTMNCAAMGSSASGLSYTIEERYVHGTKGGRGERFPHGQRLPRPSVARLRGEPVLSGAAVLYVHMEPGKASGNGRPQAGQVIVVRGDIVQVAG